MSMSDISRAKWRQLQLTAERTEDKARDAWNDFVRVWLAEHGDRIDFDAEWNAYREWCEAERP